MTSLRSHGISKCSKMAVLLNSLIKKGFSCKINIVTYLFDLLFQAKKELQNIQPIAISNIFADVTTK